MAQFDIHPTRFPEAPFVIDIQSNLLSHLLTRVVIPLRRLSSDQPLQRLQPVLEVGNASYILNTPELSSVLVSDLLPALPAAIQASSRQACIDAIDFLLTGF